MSAIVDERALRDVLARFFGDSSPLVIERPSHAAGFSGAVVLRVTGIEEPNRMAPSSPFGGWCLREWPRAGLPQLRLIELHRWIAFLAQEGIDVVPVPRSDLCGNSLVTHDGRLWQLEPWMPGVADFHQAPSHVRLQAAMQLLARLHRVAERYRPTEAGRAWFSALQMGPSPAVEQRLGIVREWTNDRLETASRQMQQDADPVFKVVAGDVIDRFRAARDAIARDLHRLSASPVPLHVCLRDIWHDHLLFTRDEVTGLIDLGAARTENVAADLSRLLGSLIGPWGERWAAALEVYTRLRPLSETEWRLVQALHVSGTHLSGMAWIQRRINGEVPDDECPRIVDRMMQLQKQWEV
ncbi:MAG: phosphotransferase [Planctomycetaceae bacterium]|nr:phosphotransferase [Planctomycetaceae bacterium]